MKRDSAGKWGLLLSAACFGCGWIWYLSVLCAGRGLVNAEIGTLTFDWIVVAVLSLGVFVLNSNFALWSHAGWLGGQLILLIWDGMPRGRSPQMFQPTNFGEALVLGFLVVVVFNWPVLPGALIGYFLRRLFRGTQTGKIPKVK